MATLTPEITLRCIDRLINAEVALRAVARSISIPAELWKPAFDASHDVRQVREELLALTVAPIEVEFV